MKQLQMQILECNIERIGDILVRAQRRCYRYHLEKSLQRDLDIAFVERIAVAQYQLQVFQKDYLIASKRDKAMDCLKDAVTQLHELGDFTRAHMGDLEDFARRSFEKEERWLRAVTVSLIGLMINICADRIRASLYHLDQKSENPVSLRVTSRKKPHLRLVK